MALPLYDDLVAGYLFAVSHRYSENNSFNIFCTNHGNNLSCPKLVPHRHLAFGFDKSCLTLKMLRSTVNCYGMNNSTSCSAPKTVRYP